MRPQETLSDDVSAGALPLRDACARLDQAVRQGGPDRAEDFLPPFADDPEAATELIYAEFCARREVGKPAAPQEFYDRFPQLKVRLERQFRIHELLDGASLEDTDRGTLAYSNGNRSRSAASASAARRDGHDTIGRYHILHELGRGAMGVVFAARHSELERAVALKVVPLGPRPDEVAVTRFRGEAKTLATLQHPNIVQIYDLDVADGEGILAMELVGGGSLAAKIAGRPKAPNWSASMVAVLARAVGHAHRAGVVHRDLKPGNVLLTDDGAPKIVDFGLARCVTRDDGQTTTGAILGTPSYMAPEQAAGQRDVAAAADIYALGAILYDLLTGRPPFQGQTPLDTLQQVLREEPVAPARLVAATPRDLETICLKCLDKEPARRYATADELADDLERFGRGEPIHARPLSPPARAWRWCRRRPWQAGMVASLAALTAVVVLGSWLTSWRLASEQNNTKKNLNRALLAEGESRAALWESLVDRARAGRWSGRAGQRFDGWAAIARAANIGREMELSAAQRLRLRNEAIACLAQTDLAPGPSVTIDIGSNQYSGVSFDGDLARVAYPARSSGVVVRWLDGSRPDQRMAPPKQCADVRRVRFSPDDRFLAARCEANEGGWVHAVYDLASGKLVFAAPASSSVTPSTLNLDFDPKVPQIIATHRDGSVRWYDLPSGKEVRKWQPAQSPSGVSVSPDGSRVAFWSGSHAEVFQVASEKKHAAFKTNSAEIHHVAWSRDGRFLACGAADHCAYLWDVANRQQHRILEGHQSQVVQVDFNPTGHLLATTSLDGTTRLWDVWTGEEQVATLGSGVQFSRDGQRLAHGLLGKVVGWWKVASGAELRAYHGHTNYEVYRIATHPRLGVAASLGPAGVQLWDIERTRPFAVLPGDWLHCGFEPQTGDLVASGESGEYRVPLPSRGDDPQSGIQDLTAKRSPMSKRVSCFTAFSTDGATRLSQDCITEETILATSASPGSKPWTLAESLQHPALSNDGLWLANKPKSGGVDIWSVRDRRQTAHLLEDTRNLAIEFSLCGRWLMTGDSNEFVVWETAGWQRRQRFPRDNAALVAANMAFAPDGRTAALAHSAFDIRLIDVESGTDVAMLPLRQGQPRPEFRFSADGRYLLQVGPKLVLVAWDLANIRRHLRDLGVDW
jgi:serine/threonine protein kinase/WD40 repeat protein